MGCSARLAEERAYPELVGRGRVRLVVVALENGTGGARNFNFISYPFYPFFWIFFWFMHSVTFRSIHLTFLIAFFFFPVFFTNFFCNWGQFFIYVYMSI